MLKKFTLVMAALVGAALVLIGCPTEAETETKYVNVPEMIHLDEVVSSEGDLRNELVDDGKELSIGVTGTVTLTAALTVPDKKAVYILPSAELDVSTYALTVDGIVYVGGTLTAKSTGTVKIPGSGHVGVVKGGELSVETAASVNDGAGAPATVLGTAKVGFASEITLTLAATGTSALDITTALGYFSNGTLDASASTIVGGLSPSAAVAAFTSSVSAAKTLVITADGAESGTSLNVPAGLALQTDEALTSVTTLTVNGGLAASSGTFGGLTANVSGTGTLIAGVADAGKAKFIIESTLKYAELASTTITDDDLVIPANTVRIFTAAAAPSGNVTVAGTVSGGGSLAVTGANTIVVGGATDKVTLTKATITGATLAGATGTVTLANTDTLVLADEGTIVVAGTGSVVLPNSTFGAGTYTAAGIVTITAVTAGDTIATAATTEKGLIIGAGNTALSLLTQDNNVATYTLLKASDGNGVVFGNGATAITVGNGTTSEASSLSASAKAKIQLGTSANSADAIKLGNASTLVLKNGAKIGAFSDTSTSVSDGSGSGGASGSIGGATVTGSSSSAHKLINSTGTLVGDADATLTGASGGTSEITTGATLVQGTFGS